MSRLREKRFNGKFYHGKSVGKWEERPGEEDEQARIQMGKVSGNISWPNLIEELWA